MLGKLQRAHPILCDHFAPAYLVGSNMLRAYLFLSYLCMNHIYQSWSYWDTASGYVFWDANGEPIWDRIKVFTRPYPPATAGIPLR